MTSRDASPRPQLPTDPAGGPPTRGRRSGRGAGRCLVVPLLLLVLSALAATAAADASDTESGLQKDDSPECMRCHWMETMAYRDRATRKIVDLSIDRDAYRHSVHDELACRDCHDRRYKHYPHRVRSAEEGLSCVGCHEKHQEDSDHSPPNLAGLDQEYQHSVHALEADEPFSCFSCHDPHSFRPLPNDTPVPQVVAANNGLCLDCHTELLTPVPEGHDWLPRPQAHWSSVRCLDCHTPLEGRDLYAPSHQILSAAESNQNCVECHSRDGELLAQLYVHRAEQEREQKGFFSHAVYNDAYIIGMSRSPIIDRIGLAIVVLMILGIGAHGYGRYLAHKRKQRETS